MGGEFAGGRAVARVRPGSFQWKARLNEMMLWEFPRCFGELWLVEIWMCTSCLFLGSEQMLFWNVMHFYNFEFSHPHRSPQEFGDMAQHTKAVLKSVSIAPVLEKRVLFFPNLFLRASKGGKYVERCFRMVYIFRVT